MEVVEHHFKTYCELIREYLAANSLSDKRITRGTAFDFYLDHGLYQFADERLIQITDALDFCRDDILELIII